MLNKNRPAMLIMNGVLSNWGGGKVSDVLKAPFPYPGGKSRVADMVWDRFGNVDNYVEPFMGSLAVLLRRPSDHFANGCRVETANDLNHYLVNFWRAVRAEPDKVAEFADWPVTEADLHARHQWLVKSQESQEWRERMRTDPDCYDAKIAGWWVWGACCWIGSGWCDDTRGLSSQVPELVNNRGHNAAVVHECAAGSVDRKQRPQMDAGGRGRHGRPQLTDAFDIGRGVNGGGNYTRPDLAGGNSADSSGVTLSASSTCNDRREWLTDWMRRLADRLRLVRTCYGHWARVCDSDSTLTRLGTTGVFLDPPYPIKTSKGARASGLYANDKSQDLNALRDEVLAWCRKWGDDPQIRVAVCGYEGDGYDVLIEERGWSVEAWEASGGYGNQSKTKTKAENAKRERIWFSPACLRPEESRGLFDGIE